MSRILTMQEKHPELFMTSNEDPRKRKRVVPMQVLSLGMPRTGTASMQLALQILGYPCYHGLTLIANIRDTEMWNKALDAKFFGMGASFTRAEWDQLLGNYSAVADLPAVAFPEDLLRCYPDAKVILVKRDIEKWYQSFNEGIIMNVWSPVLQLIARFDSRLVGKLAATSSRWTKGLFKAHSRQEMQQKARFVYEEHYALVERVTPKEQLLTFKLEDGWGPLCKFLNKPIPDVEFPRVNEAAALSEKIGLIAQRGMKNTAIISAKVLLSLAVLAFAWWLLHTTLYRRR